MNRFQQCRNKITKHWWFWLMISIVYLIIVQIAFYYDAKWDWLAAEWDAGDILVFTGTIALGFAAWKQSVIANEQSEVANKMNKRLIEIESDRYKLEFRPFIMIADYSAYTKNRNAISEETNKLYIEVQKAENNDDDVLCIELLVVNTTNSYMTAKYNGAEFIDSECSWNHTLLNKKDDILRFMPGESQPFTLCLPTTEYDKIISKKIKLKFVLENRFSKKYAEYFHIIIVAMKDNIVGYSTLENWFISMFIQEFSLFRFENDSEGNKVEIQEEI